MATATDPEAFATFYRRDVRGLLAFFRRRGARRRGWSEDRVRRALGTAPIVLTDEGIERVSRGLRTMRSQTEVSGDA